MNCKLKKKTNKPYNIKNICKSNKINDKILIKKYFIAWFLYHKFNDRIEDYIKFKKITYINYSYESKNKIKCGENLNGLLDFYSYIDNPLDKNVVSMANKCLILIKENNDNKEFNIYDDEKLLENYNKEIKLFFEKNDPNKGVDFTLILAFEYFNNLLNLVTKYNIKLPKKIIKLVIQHYFRIKRNNIFLQKFTLVSPTYVIVDDDYLPAVYSLIKRRYKFLIKNLYGDKLAIKIQSKFRSYLERKKLSKKYTNYINKFIKNKKIENKKIYSAIKIQNKFILFHNYKHCKFINLNKVNINNNKFNCYHIFGSVRYIIDEIINSEKKNDDINFDESTQLKLLNYFWGNNIRGRRTVSLLDLVLWYYIVKTNNNEKIIKYSDLLLKNCIKYFLITEHIYISYGGNLILPKINNLPKDFKYDCSKIKSDNIIKRSKRIIDYENARRAEIYELYSIGKEELKKEENLRKIYDRSKRKIYDIKKSVNNILNQKSNENKEEDSLKLNVLEKIVGNNPDFYVNLFSSDNKIINIKEKKNKITNIKENKKNKIIKNEIKKKDESLNNKSIDDICNEINKMDLFKNNLINKKKKKIKKKN